MSASYERPYSQENPLSGVAELLLQEKVRKNLKAALGIIEWDKTRMRRDGIMVETVGTFISPAAQLYEIVRANADDQYAVWQYGLNAYNQAGRPIAPKMSEYRAEPGSHEGVTRLSQEENGSDVILDASNPQIIYVDGSSIQALEATDMLQQIGIAAPRG